MDFNLFLVREFKFHMQENRDMWMQEKSSISNQVQRERVGVVRLIIDVIQKK